MMVHGGAMAIAVTAAAMVLTGCTDDTTLEATGLQE